MQKLENEKLESIKGGEIGVWVYLITSTIVVFLSGMLDGYTNPKACGK